MTTASAGTTRRAPGRAKAVLARDHVRRVNPWSAVASLAVDLAVLTPGMLASLGVAIVAVDNERARFLASRLLIAARVPYVDAGVRADLWMARATVSSPADGGACLIDAWTPEHLARAGEDVGMPCVGIETGDGFPSTLVMGQAAAAVAAHQALALAGVTGEPACTGHELRLDLRAGRLERFRLQRNPRCAADHVLGSAPIVWRAGEPRDVRLGDLMRECAVTPEMAIVLGAGELVTAAVCRGCLDTCSAYRATGQPLSPCPRCGGQLAATRRARRVRWGEAAGVAARKPASAWFRSGDVFAVEDGSRVRVYGFGPPALPWEPGSPWTAAESRVRFARLPKQWDLGRVRETRIGIIGLGHLGAAVLQQLAPLPWKGILAADRDVLGEHNLHAYALAADGGAGETV